MRKPVQIIGTTLGAAAIIGATGAAASAHGGDDHHGFARHDSFGGHDSFGHHGRGDAWSDRSWGGDQRSSDHAFDPQYGADGSTDHWDHHWWGSDAFAHRGRVTPYGDQRSGDETTAQPASSTSDRHGWTFDQRKAAIVSALQAADARLTALQDKLTSAAANDPSGFAPKALPYVTQARAHVESLLSQVQAATTDQQLAEILHQAPAPEDTLVPTS